MSSKRILGIGRVVVDHVLVVPRYPDCDTKCLATDSWRQVGGPVPIALSTAAFYGMQCSYWGVWGDDPDGREVAQELASRGVAVSGPVIRGTTGCSQIWSEAETGRRTIACLPAAELTLGDMPIRPELGDFDILHLDGTSADVALQVAREMQARRATIVLDAGSRKPGMQQLMPHLDLLVASNLFCQSWFGHVDVSRDELLALGPQAVIRTRGAKGATLYRSNQTLHVDAIEVPTVDTNGAGDIFCGALLRGLADEWPMEQTLRFANHVAGHSCRFRGNRTLPDVSLLRDPLAKEKFA